MCAKTVAKMPGALVVSLSAQVSVANRPWDERCECCDLEVVALTAALMWIRILVVESFSRNFSRSHAADMQQFFVELCCGAHSLISSSSWTSNIQMRSLSVSFDVGPYGFKFLEI